MLDSGYTDEAEEHAGVCDACFFGCKVSLSRHGLIVGGQHTACQARYNSVVNEAHEDRIRELVGERDTAREHADDAETRLHDAIRAALQDRMSAIKLAELTGLTRSRIYQIRDGRR